MSEQQAHETLYLACKRAKTQWRSFTHKPVPKFRRFVKKSFKGKGKGSRYMYTQDDVVYLLNRKGKGNKGKSMGKGFGRSGKNPKDRSGNVLRCRVSPEQGRRQGRQQQR